MSTQTQLSLRENTLHEVNESIKRLLALKVVRFDLYKRAIDLRSQVQRQVDALRKCQ